MLKAIVTNFIIGFALIALGLIPGLLAGFKEGIENLRGEFDARFGGRSPDSQFPIIPRNPRTTRDDRLLPAQIWVAAGGAVLILISLLAFLTR